MVELKNKTISICFNYFLEDDQVKLYDSLIDFKSYTKLDNELFQLSRTWYLQDENKYIWKHYSLGYICSLDNYFYNLKYIKFLLFIYDNNLHNGGDLNIYLSKNEKINKVFSSILECYSINYTVLYKDVKLPEHFKKDIDKGNKESNLKLFIRKSIKFFNNLIKMKSSKKLFYQNYHNAASLMETIDYTFVTDRLPSLYDIFNFKKPLYTDITSYSTDISVNEVSGDWKNILFKDAVGKLFKSFYDFNQEKYKLYILEVEKEFFNKGIKDFIVVHENPTLSLIFQEYLKTSDGSLSLYPHGVRDYNIFHQGLCKVDKVFCWGEYDYFQLKKLNVKKIVKLGYPNYYEKRSFDVENYSKMDISELKVLVLGITGSVQFVASSEKYLADLSKEVIKRLLEIGIKSSNITVKIHPGKLNREFYIKLFSELLPVNNIKQGGDIFSLIKENSIVFGEPSTVFYESVFLAKKFILFDPFKYLNLEHVHNEYAQYSINSVEELDRDLLLSDFEADTLDYITKNILYKTSNKEKITMMKMDI